MRIQKPRHPRLGSVGVILIAAIVSGCALLAESPSPLRGSPTAIASEQTPIPTVVATPLDQTPTPTVAATPTPPPVSAELLPVDGAVLPIAGRNGAPGAISCSGQGRFTFETIPTPTGAEDRPGPEFDVLRATIARYGDDPEFDLLKNATYGELHRDASSVVFIGDVGNHEGPFAVIQANFDGASWKWGGMGDCQLIGEPGDGWGGANWVIDPAFDPPTSASRKLHLLVSEVDCNPSVPIVGRLAPAYVFFEPGRVRIQVVVRAVEPPGSCDGIGPTDLGPPVAVTLTLPEQLEARQLRDSTPDPCRGCGG